MNRLLCVLPLLAALALAGCGAGNEGEEAEGEAAAEIHVATVTAGTLHPTLDLVGTLAPVPERTVVLSPAIPGQITQLAAHEGQTVKTGDTLMALDARTHQADLAKAQAALDEARANLAMLQRGAMPEEVEAARQEARSAAAAAASLDNKLKALEALRDKGEISPVQFEQAQSAKAEAEAAGKAAQERAKLLASGTRPEVMDQAKAKLAGAEADVAAQQLAVSQCTITSPIDGVVTALPVRQGMFVDQPTVLARVIDLSTLFAAARIPSRALAQLKEGAEATVSVAGRDFPGSVERIGKEADPQTGDMDAFVAVANADSTLQPGVACTISISLPEIPDALAVPVAAVADHSGKTVVTVIRENKAYETEVEIGVKTRELVQILKGVAAGDIVATEGGYGLPDECPVKIVTDEPDAEK